MKIRPKPNIEPVVLDPLPHVCLADTYLLDERCVGAPPRGEERPRVRTSSTPTRGVIGVDLMLRGRRTTTVLRVSDDGSTLLSLTVRDKTEWLRVDERCVARPPLLSQREVRRVLACLAKEIDPALEGMLPEAKRWIELRERMFRGAHETPAEEVVAHAMVADRLLRAKAAKQAAERYGVLPRHWDRLLADARLIPFVEALLERGPRWPFLFVIAAGEGFNAELEAAGTSFDMRRRVDGFASLGTDTFGERVDALKERGTLRENFSEYEPMERMNELGERVISAGFHGVRPALEALEAMLADERANVLRDLGGRKVPERVLDYYTYVYFNAGAVLGGKILAHDGARMLAWSGAPPANARNARFNALERMATLDVLEHVFFRAGQIGEAVAARAAHEVHR